MTMRRHCIALLLALSAPIAAQSQSTAPAGFEKAPGDRWTYYLGGYPNARFQMADGEFRGTAKTITQVEFRAEELRFFTSSSGAGRKWSLVTLDMGTTDHTAMSTTFSANRLTTMTRVFSSSTMQWPTLTGTQTSTPWGHVKFPFNQSPWVYSGKADLLFEYVFSGGQLANAATWGSSSRKSYYLDGLNSSTSSSLVTGAYWPAVVPVCNDSAITSTSFARTYLQTTVYSPTSTSTFKGQVVFATDSSYTAPNAGVASVLAVGSKTGRFVPFAACNTQLYTNLVLPFVLILKTADAAGKTTRTSFNIPYNSSFAGTTVWAQSAWTDSKTNQFSLTCARFNDIPTWPRLYKKTMVYDYRGSPTAVTGASSSSVRQTLPLLTYK
jgi:hypothetical protein